MAFEELKKVTGAGRKGSPHVRGMVTGGQLVVSVPAAIVEAFGSPRAFRILKGSGEDAGRIALVPAPINEVSAYSLAKPKNSAAFVLRLTAKRLGVGAVSLSTTTLAHSIESGRLLVDIRPLHGDVQAETRTTQCVIRPAA